MNRLESVFLFWAPVKTGVAVLACRFWNGTKQLWHTVLRRAEAGRLFLRSVCPLRLRVFQNTFTANPGTKNIGDPSYFRAQERKPQHQQKDG